MAKKTELAAPSGAGAVVLDDPQAEALEAMVRGTMAAGVFTEDIPRPAIEAACGLALALGLDPIQGDVLVYTARKNVGTKQSPRWVMTHVPYVQGSALAKWVAKFPQFRGYDERILDEGDKKQLMIDPAALAVETTLYRADWVDSDGKMLPIRGIGTANPKAPFRGNPIEVQFPYDMACWRSLRRAVRRGFPTDTSIGRRMISQDFAIVEIEEAVNELPAPERIADDEWQGFYTTMTEWGVTHDRVHQLLAEAGYTIEHEGEHSVRYAGLTPEEAGAQIRSLMVAMGLNDPNPNPDDVAPAPAIESIPAAQSALWRPTEGPQV